MSISATQPAAPRLDYADRLYALLFDGKPKRASWMTGRNTQDGKYIDIQEYSFTRAQFCDHLAGRETYASTLSLVNTCAGGLQRL